MSIIKLNFYKRLSDQELIDEIFENIKIVNRSHDNDIGENCDYWNKVKTLDNLIKECKRRKISIDAKCLVRQIFTI